MKQAKQDWRDHRYGQAVKGFIKREWPILAWLSSFVLIAFALVQTSQFSAELRDASVAGCERQNLVREATRGILEDQIKSSRQINREDVFPNIPPELYRRLIARSNQQRRERIEQLAPADCTQAYP